MSEENKFDFDSSEEREPQSHQSESINLSRKKLLIRFEEV